MDKLLDEGNLVLLHNNIGGSPLWQSFDHPTDTALPSMKFGWNRLTELDSILTSWTSVDDSGIGKYSVWFDRHGYPQFLVSEGKTIHWRGDSWLGTRWSGIPQMAVKFIFNVSFVANENEVSYIYRLHNDSILTRLVIDELGTLYRSTWLDKEQRWLKFYSAPTETYDAFEFGGPDEICDPVNKDVFECVCLPGYEPKSAKDWMLRDGLGSCVRKPDPISMCGNGEGFVKFAGVKVPDTSEVYVNMSMSLKSCEEECLRNCSCVAYSSATVKDGPIGCLV